MLAFALSLNGCKVYITSRKRSVLQDTVKEINDAVQAERMFAVESNLTTKQECDQLALEIRNREAREIS